MSFTKVPSPALPLVAAPTNTGGVAMTLLSTSFPFWLLGHLTVGLFLHARPETLPWLDFSGSLCLHILPYRAMLLKLFGSPSHLLRLQFTLLFSSLQVCDGGYRKLIKEQRPQYLRRNPMLLHPWTAYMPWISSFVYIFSHSSSSSQVILMPCGIPEADVKLLPRTFHKLLVDGWDFCTWDRKTRFLTHCAFL